MMSMERSTSRVSGSIINSIIKPKGGAHVHGETQATDFGSDHVTHVRR